MMLCCVLMSDDGLSVEFGKLSYCCCVQTTLCSVLCSVCCVEKFHHCQSFTEGNVSYNDDFHAI